MELLEHLHAFLDWYVNVCVPFLDEARCIPIAQDWFGQFLKALVRM